MLNTSRECGPLQCQYAREGAEAFCIISRLGLRHWDGSRTARHLKRNIWKIWGGGAFDKRKTARGPGPIGEPGIINHPLSIGLDGSHDPNMLLRIQISTKVLREGTMRSPTTAFHSNLNSSNGSLFPFAWRSLFEPRIPRDISGQNLFGPSAPRLFGPSRTRVLFGLLSLRGPVPGSATIKHANSPLRRSAKQSPWNPASTRLDPRDRG
jgi:hypothetical protein